jgi:methylmalonyl-CoA carboxyltransferase large subunit
MTTEMQASELETLIGDIRAQLAALAERVARLETPAGQAVAATPSEHIEETAAKKTPPRAVETPAGPEPITEEELLAISAALAAYFGVRVHVRQIRLISSSAWAQQGRVSIQASHRLY